MPRLADHLSRVVYSKVGRTAVIVAAELDFRLRRLRHPEISFSDFYTERIIRTIDSGGVHRTLGKSWLRDGIDAEERERLLQAFRRNGLHTFGALVDYGLEPQHTCVDYGCGMLRVGRHLIPFLDRGNYWGLDVTDRLG